MPAAATLSRRELNRALLARQLLLARSELAPAQVLTHLLGMQSQEPQAPYVGLWSRIEGFAPEQLSELIEQRHAVRGALMRTTVHLVTAADWRVLTELMQPVLARGFKGSRFSKHVAAIDQRQLLRAGRELLNDRPHSRPELGRLLAQRWPGVDQPSMAQAVTMLTAVVQAPPRGLWRRGGQARWIAADVWLESGAQPPGSTGPNAVPGPTDPPQLPEQLQPTDPTDPIESVVLRYLAAFGPATVMDIQAWCGLTRLAPVVERLRDRLRSFRGEQGQELLDLPDAPLPGAEARAPVRFLAPFDNAILAHADRSRIVAPCDREGIYRDRLLRTFLLDGFVAGTWRVDGEALSVQPLHDLSVADHREVTAEGERLLRFLAPDAAAPRIQFDPPWR